MRADVADIEVLLHTFWIRRLRFEFFVDGNKGDSFKSMRRGTSQHLDKSLLLKELAGGVEV